MTTSSAPPRNSAAKTPPKKIPKTKKRFHNSLRQLYWKNGIFAGTHIAHTCRSVEDIPNDLFPNSNNAGTVRPISGPEIYQGHGFESVSIKSDIPILKRMKS